MTTITIGYSFNACSGSQTFSGLDLRTAPDVTCIPGPCSGSISSYRAFGYASSGPIDGPRTVVNGLFVSANRAEGQAGTSTTLAVEPRVASDGQPRNVETQHTIGRVKSHHVMTTPARRSSRRTDSAISPSVVGWRVGSRLRGSAHETKAGRWGGWWWVVPRPVDGPVPRKVVGIERTIGGIARRDRWIHRRAR